MQVKDIFHAGNIFLDTSDLETFKAIAPQQSPTSDRIKALLSRGLMTPGALTPDEVQELCGSIAYHLLAERFR